MKDLSQAVSVLSQGGVVAFPTETYYGLAVDPFNQSALLKLYKVKGRPKNKAILLLIEKIEQLNELTLSIPDIYLPLINKYWPGPLTLIFPAAKNIDPLLTGGSGTIGIRISSHNVAQDICKAWRNPITATSANISGNLPAKTSKEVYEIFGDSIDLILDAGETSAGLCSTIVACKDNKLNLIRTGQIDFSELQNIIIDCLR